LLRIGFDGRALTSPAAGVRRYASELLRGMMALGDAIQLVIVGGAESAAVPAGCQRITEPPHPPTNAGWSIVGLPWAARRGRVDVLHSPAYTGPFWSAMPIVLTIHDVSYARHPEWFPYRRDAVRRAFYRRCALSATAIITDSEFSAGEIRAAYGVEPSRITVVPLGVNRSHAKTPDATTGDLPAGVRPPFLLHVGDLHERRNLPTVVKALLDARRLGGPLSSLTLVMAGVDHGVGDGLMEQAARGGAAGSVVRLGRVDEEQLWTMYRKAAALVYPSLYEGFGLPLLEAMACGTPVIAARAASIPEVVGSAGVLVDPMDVARWTEAIARVITDPDLRDSLKDQGLERAALYSWERTARSTIEVYRWAARRA
jgi:glycosyltransferase involved in cell wall biosynthesis